MGSGLIINGESATSIYGFATHIETGLAESSHAWLRNIEINLCIHSPYAKFATQLNGKRL
jgi:hypothetical protein